MQDHVNALGQPIGAPVEDSFPKARPPKTEVHGQYCMVVPADTERHTEGLFKAFQEDHENRIWTYLPYGPFETVEGFADWMSATCTGEDPLFHTILDEKGAPLGLASYLRIEPTAGVIEVGHINFAPRLQRSRLATEAMYLMMKRVFDELGYRRYEWKCDALNAGSRRAAERLGFQYEGLFRQATHYKGRNRDTAWYSILDREWPSISDAFQTWLDPDNFDAEGNQKSRLSTRPG